MEVKPFSFAGFSMSIPREWDVSTIKITKEGTTIGIQDLERGRLEINWQVAGWKKAKDQARRTRKPLDKKLLEPEEVAEKYHRDVRKKLKDLEYDDEMTQDKVDGHRAVISRWEEAGQTGYEAIWYCGVSDRYYYLRYVDGQGPELFKALLGSVVCHSSLPTVKWQYLGLDLELPKDYTIDEQKAEVGKLTVVFYGHWELPGRKRSLASWLRPPPLPPPRVLVVSRWNLLRYGNSKLEDWTEEQATSLIKKYVGSCRKEPREGEVQVNGHRAWFTVFSHGGGLIKKPSIYFSVYGWVCDASETAYILINPLPLGERWGDLAGEPIPPPDYVHCHR